MKRIVSFETADIKECRDFLDYGEIVGAKKLANNEYLFETNTQQDDFENTVLRLLHNATSITCTLVGKAGREKTKKLK